MAGLACAAPMRVHLGSDDAGFELKVTIVRRLTELGHEPVDHGPVKYDAVDDYPPYVLAAAAASSPARMHDEVTALAILEAFLAAGHIVTIAAAARILFWCTACQV